MLNETFLWFSNSMCMNMINFLTKIEPFYNVSPKLLLAFIPACPCFLSVCPISKKPSRLDTPWIFYDHQMTTCKVVLSEPVGLGHWWVKMAKLLSIISILVTSFCIGFLILMGTKCVVKLSEELKGTNVDIVKASKHLYPTITICSIDARVTWFSQITLPVWYVT